MMDKALYDFKPGTKGIGQTRKEKEELEQYKAEKKEAIVPYSKGLDRNPEVLWAEAIAFVRRAQEDIFEAGRRFIVLKEKLGHGNFVKGLDERGIDRRRAWEIMVITRKFANVRTLGHLGKAKLLALSHASDEEIQQLEQTGRIFDIPQEELAGVTYRELKEAIKKEKEKNQRGQEQLTELEKENHQLKTELQIIKSGNQTPERYMEQFNKADQYITKAIKIINALPEDVIKENFELQVKVNAACISLERMVANVTRNIIDYSE
jgi:hypothetical protein